MQVRGFVTALVVGVSALAPAAAAAHWLDHAGPPPVSVPPPSSNFNSGGPGAEWELIETVTTGNPHTDLDFFTQGGETYASVGTLAVGPNGGGQTIVKLTDGGNVDPELIAQHSLGELHHRPQRRDRAPARRRGVAEGQRDPQRRQPLRRPHRHPDHHRRHRRARAAATTRACSGSRAPRRRAGSRSSTSPTSTKPVEIGLTSHIGEAHTVNVDPKRPHIAYAVTSDSVSVNARRAARERGRGLRRLARPRRLRGRRHVLVHELPRRDDGRAEARRLPPAGLPLPLSRTSEMALGHTVKTGSTALFGCHELEVYPDDKLTCGSGNALIELDMSGAFDDMGTPTDFSDDKPRGTPLPCQVRAELDGRAGRHRRPDHRLRRSGPAAGTTDLDIPSWIAAGRAVAARASTGSAASSTRAAARDRRRSRRSTPPRTSPSTTRPS